MCGFTGAWSKGGTDQHDVVKSMTERLVHRGPNSSGIWTDPPSGVGLGHRRLSILDLSEAGHQPMTSSSGRFAIAYNGEIYNHLELRASLDQGTRWRGHSDTETLLACIEQWGLARTLERCLGMFAFALWDKDKGVMHLVRDRVGIKPLFFGWAGNAFVFGSELKALRRHPDFTGAIDSEALALFLRFGFVPSPWCIYQGFKKLPAGSWLTMKHPADREAQPEHYWDIETVAANGRQHPFAGDPKEAEQALETLLLDAVAKRQLSDVPLGALLSGGIDSSLVVALMQRQSEKPVNTFSIGFADAQYDESKSARAIAKHLGTEHHELKVTPEDALAVIPDLPTLYDEPFADSSQIPTTLVCQLAKRNVTVALTGDGGDEAWGGYDRHVWGQRVWNALRPIPHRTRSFLGRGATAISPQAWDRALKQIDPLLPLALRLRMPGHKIHKLANLAKAQTPEDLYLRLSSLAWKTPNNLLKHGREPPLKLLTGKHDLPFADLAMLCDLKLGFPDDMLTKVDRASMAVSLECRVPLADHRLIEFAWSLPLSMKIRNGRGKWLPRQVLYRHVPQALVDRPKMGFGVPIGDWLRHPLRAWAEDLLSVQNLQSSGLLEPEPIRQAWTEHLSGRVSRHVELWAVLMFQAWYAQDLKEAIS